MVTIEHIRQNHIESFYIIYCGNKKIWIFDIRIIHFKSKSDFFHKIQFEDNSSMWAKKEKFYKNWETLYIMEEYCPNLFDDRITYGTWPAN